MSTSSTPRTDYPERYGYANLNDPRIAQAVFHCRDCGNLVFELRVHDEKFHDRMDQLELGAIAKSLADRSESAVGPSRITEPAVDVAPPKSAPRPVKDSPQA